MMKEVMNIAKARIKLQIWEWIPDTSDTAGHVVVYDPNTIMPVYQGVTNSNGFVEFEIDPGMYVIWVYGHNPMGYRPFLSDTWIAIAVLPGETKEVCAALISLIDIPVLYKKAQEWFHWEPESFAELLDTYSTDVQQECNKTALKQREVFINKFGDLKNGKVERLVEPIKLADALVKNRDTWAEKVAIEAKAAGPTAMKLAEIAKAIHVVELKKRMIR